MHEPAESHRRTAVKPLWLSVVLALGAAWVFYAQEFPEFGPQQLQPVSAPEVRKDRTSEALPDLPTEVAGESATSTPAPPRRQSPAGERPQAEKPQQNPWLISNVTIRDQSGKVVYRGDVDLTPTFARIERGERHAHRNDGGVFRNLEKRLPRQPEGYYREYVHPTPNLSGPGPQRLVIGTDGDVYYTHDHYRTFRKIRGPQ